MQKHQKADSAHLHVEFSESFKHNWLSIKNILVIANAVNVGQVNLTLGVILINLLSTVYVCVLHIYIVFYI